MVKCENYAVGEAQHPNDPSIEVTIGIEYTDDDDIDEMTINAKAVAAAALWRHGGNHGEIAKYAQDIIPEQFPGRAFYAETREHGRGVQVYQPFGMPRELCAACGGKLCR
jgi:hypothetical protein